jgi:trigger factor
MLAGQTATFRSQLVGGDQSGDDADIEVTVRTVKEKQLPELDDSFAQLASEFDTLDELKADLRARLGRVKKAEQLYAARDETLKAIVAASDVPTPEGVVRDEVESRKEQMSEELERIGTTLPEFLETQGKSEEEMDTELNDAAAEAVRVQLVLDTLADQEEITVTDDEFGHEIVHRAQRAGAQPQEYYERLVAAGLAGSVFGDVRRGKALAAVMERVKITDADGKVLSMDELRAGLDDHDDDHHDDHEGHDHD